jgi:hypothetical protein
MRARSKSRCRRCSNCWASSTHEAQTAKHQPQRHDRAARFRAIKDELQQASGLPETIENTLRITEAAWLRLGRENLEARILQGHVLT